VRCAIYTRKSSEEGLEQDFNSLHAQREACEAYIKSQRHEGWLALGEAYDDGGISGATMERPALRQLLADIAAGKIDTVVVYKVDRLTRTLSDFAKIVDIFDAHSVAFVSVTQQFNTTTSMGRLTLNMLLSFAQFEREVTGERIRDKIAASKQRGMWMGGTPPLGYDPHQRTLVVNAAEAETVRHIYQRYVSLGSVRLLKRELDAAGIVGKRWTSAGGRCWGGQALARGALYLMLQNRLYRGEIVHKGKHYPGTHDAIIDETLWDQAQTLLQTNAVDRPAAMGVKNRSLLAGRIYDAKGNRMTPSHTVKNGKRYRYYVSHPLLTEGQAKPADLMRLPATEIERLVADRLGMLLGDDAALFDLVSATTATTSEQKQLMSVLRTIGAAWSSQSPADLARLVATAVMRVDVAASEVAMTVSARRLCAAARGTSPGDALGPDQGEDEHPFVITMPAELARVGYGAKLVVSPSGVHTGDVNAGMVRLLGQAHRIWQRLLKEDHASVTALAREESMTGSYVSRIVRIALLAPDITQAILSGTQPPTLTVVKLMQSGTVPADWQEQRAMFGFV
jgi:DNA invertase Pin-like site-specific DNA recombinase